MNEAIQIGNNPEHLHVDVMPIEHGLRVIEELEADRIHGYPHIDRLLAWYNHAIENSHILEVPLVSDYTRAAVDAIHRHDFMEVASAVDDKVYDKNDTYENVVQTKTKGDKNQEESKREPRKEGHREAGALYSLAVDTIIEQHFDEYQALTKIKMTKKEWHKKKWATAFMILYHHPEEMPTLEQIRTSGKLIDIKRIRDIAEPFADLVESYKNFESVFTDLEHEDQPYFSDLEIEAIRSQAYLVAFADKMDQLMPIEASSNRTILLNPNRNFYVKEGFPKDEELDFDARIVDGKKDVSKDTFSRMLFEITRTAPFSEAPDEIQQLYKQALHQKAIFLREGISSFLSGDFTPFVRYYDGEIQRVLKSPLKQLKFPDAMVEAILSARDGRRTLEAILRQYGIDVEHLNQEINKIEKDRADVLQILKLRHEAMNKKNLLEPSNTNRIRRLLDRAVSITDGSNVSTDTIELPYETLNGVKIIKTIIQ